MVPKRITTGELYPVIFQGSIQSVEVDDKNKVTVVLSGNTSTIPFMTLMEFQKLPGQHKVTIQPLGAEPRGRPDGDE